MFSLSYSEEKNRIYIKLNGLLSEAEFNTYKNNIMALIDNSKAGFTVLADLSLCDSTVLANSDNFNVIREYGAKKDFKARALVLGTEAYKLYNSNLQGAFLNIEEAEAYLNKL